MITKLYNDLENLSINSYRKSSEEVQSVVNNNTKEFSITKEMLTQLDKHMRDEIQTTGLTHFPQKTKHCRDEHANKKEIIGKYVMESENVCLVFISNVFSLIENDALYKNLTNTKIFIDKFKRECGNKTTSHDIDRCFGHKIQSTRNIIKELKSEVDYFLQNVRERASGMAEYLHRCYDTVRKDVLNKKVREANRQFLTCIRNIKNDEKK